MGPMTGRRAGYCAGYDVPGCANPMWGMGGRGGAWGGRGGYGFRHWFHATGMPGWMRGGYAPAGYGPLWGPPPPPTPEQEMEMLRAEAEQLKQALAQIEQRLDELTPKE